MSRFMKTAVGIMLIVLILLLSACVKTPEGVASFPLNGEIRSTPLLDMSLHMSFKEDLSEIASDGRLTLLRDERSKGIAVYDASADAYWSALPLSVNSSGAVLTAALASETGRYYLNSQDNSVFFGSFETEKTEDGVRISYVLSDAADTAEKTPETLSPGDLYLRVPVLFRLTEGELRVSVDCAEIFISSGYVLESLSLLPYFGALTDTQQSGGSYGRFLLVPDGCGAVMYTEHTDAATENLTFRVYGKETGVNNANAAVGCFGIGCGSAAMAAVISAGDAIASVRAIRASANTDAVNIVYPEFNITPYTIRDKTYAYAEAFSGKIEVRYQFLSDTLGAYAPLAAACREMLIRSGFLSDRIVPKGEYPLNVSFICSADGRASTVSGKLEQAEEVAGLLKAKGVNSMNLVLNGMFTHGLYQAGSYSVLRSVGGKKALRDLCNFAAAQDIPVYAGVNLFTSSAASKAASDLFGEEQKRTILNPLYPSVAAKGRTCYLATPDGIERNTVGLLDRTAALPLTGYAVNDTGFLYADAASGADAEAVANAALNAIHSVQAQNRVLIRGGTFRFLKTASLVTELPEEPSFTQSEAYVSVPLLQMLLHGTVAYSGSACNTAPLLTIALLRSVEYGASIAVEWAFLPQSELFYERTYSETADFYERAANVLADLSDCRITGHEKISDGVFVVSYGSGAIIYVNYNHFSVNIGSISVPPYDFIRIN